MKAGGVHIATPKSVTGPLPFRPNANVGNFSAGKQPEE